MKIWKIWCPNDKISELSTDMNTPDIERITKHLFFKDLLLYESRRVWSDTAWLAPDSFVKKDAIWLPDQTLRGLWRVAKYGHLPQRFWQNNTPQKKNPCTYLFWKSLIIWAYFPMIDSLSIIAGSIFNYRGIFPYDWGIMHCD